MAFQNSYHNVAEQIISLNNNLVDMLSKINNLATSQEPSVTINITDQSGIAKQFSIPSFGYLKSEIERLNNNINSIYNVDYTGKTKKALKIENDKMENNIFHEFLVKVFKNAYNVLKDGGIVIYPLRKTTYSSCMGSLIDKFGFRWGLMTEQNT